MGACRTKSFGGPSRYIQGPGEMDRLAMHTEKFGNKMFAIIDPFFYDDLSPKLKKQYEDAGASFEAVPFEVDVTEARIAATVEKAKASGANVIMGIGGGKSIDTAKGVAYYTNLPLVVVPTTSSTDAPTSSSSVIYNEQHEYDKELYYSKNPNIVIMDSQVIANAPVRFLVSGMGDAMATMFESKAMAASNCGNYICTEVGCFKQTRLAMAIAQLCYDTIMEYGIQAKIANENHVVTEALEAVIEANTLMSGLGFENTACAAAHGISDGFTKCPNGTNALHGERVAFGALCELVAENASQDQIEEYVLFCIEVGLPVTLEDLGIEATEENIQIIADNASSETYHEPFESTNDMIKAFVKAADATGHYYQNLVK